MYHADYAAMVFINNQGSLFVNDFITFHNEAIGDKQLEKFRKLFKVKVVCCVQSLPIDHGINVNTILGHVKLQVSTVLSSEQTAIVYSNIEMLYPDESTFTLHDVVSVCLEQIVDMSHPTH